MDDEEAPKSGQKIAQEKKSSKKTPQRKRKRGSFRVSKKPPSPKHVCICSPKVADCPLCHGVILSKTADNVMSQPPAKKAKVVPPMMLTVFTTPDAYVARGEDEGQKFDFTFPFGVTSEQMADLTNPVFKEKLRAVRTCCGSEVTPQVPLDCMLIGGITLELERKNVVLRRTGGELKSPELQPQKIRSDFDAFSGDSKGLEEGERTRKDLGPGLGWPELQPLGSEMDAFTGPLIKDFEEQARDARIALTNEITTALIKEGRFHAFEHTLTELVHDHGWTIIDVIS